MLVLRGRFLKIAAQGNKIPGLCGQKFVPVIDDPEFPVELQPLHSNGGHQPALQRGGHHAVGEHRNAQAADDRVDQCGRSAPQPR